MSGKKLLLDTNAVIGLVSIRKKYRFKLPDAIIIATALSCGAILVAGDKAPAKIKETGVFPL